jgi:hypothetical protein
MLIPFSTFGYSGSGNFASVCEKSQYRETRRQPILDLVKRELSTI